MSHLLGNVVTHGEAVEEAFLAAADAFQSTELPLHRVAWLRKLVEFHSSRFRFAEEGTCRFLIHKTLRVRMRTGDWDAGGSKHLFYGVTFPSEYNNVSPWISYRELEEDMVKEAEAAGELFLKAGIVESSRYARGLSSQFYSSADNYAKMAYVYRKLALVVESQVLVSLNYHHH